MLRNIKMLRLNHMPATSEADNGFLHCQRKVFSQIRSIWQGSIHSLHLHHLGFEVSSLPKGYSVAEAFQAATSFHRTVSRRVSCFKQTPDAL